MASVEIPDDIVSLSGDEAVESNQRQDAHEDAMDEDAAAGPIFFSMDREMEAHLLSVCQAVGGYEIDDHDGQGDLTETYILGDEALECLRDLKRFLRYDDKTEGKCILRKLGEWRFLHTDLIPIFTKHAEKPRLVEAATELMVPLTWPMDPKETAFQEQLRYLNSYKSAMNTEEVMQSLFRYLLAALSKEHRDRTDRDLDTIRLLLTLCRNLLSIPDPQVTNEVSAELNMRGTMQERLIRKMNDCHLLELFISFAGSMDEHHNAEWNLIVLEIFYLIFAPYDPACLLEKPAEEENMLLKSLISKEKETKTGGARFQPSRHGRFGGSIMIQAGPHMKRVLTGTKPLDQQIDNMFDSSKKEFIMRDKKTKQKDYSGNYKPIQDDRFRKVLREVADGFLESCFNVLMISVKQDLAAERTKVRDEDYQRYLAMVTFFLKYQQEKAAKTCTTQIMNVELVAGALDRMSIVFVLKQIEKHFTEKKPIPLRISISSFTQMLGILRIMSEAENGEIRDVAHNLVSNLLYERAYMDLLRTIVKFPLTLTKGFLEDLVAMNHILLRIIERHAKEQNVIFARQRVRKKVNRAAANGEENLEDTMQGEDEEEEDLDQGYEYQDKTFEFQQIEMGYATESVITTYYYLLRDYETLKQETIGYICKMFHRIFVKCDVQPLFYRLDLLDVFNDIMAERIHLSRKTPAFKELVTFIRFVISRMVKKFTDYPLLFVELLYPKARRSDIVRIQNKDPDLANVLGDQDEAQGPPEIEVSETIPWSERIGVLVTLLHHQEEKHDLLQWICDIMTEVARERSDGIDSDFAGGNGDYVIHTDHEAHQKALTHDGHFRALLTLFRFVEKPEGERSADVDESPADTPKAWIIPITMLSSDLVHNVNMVQQYVQTPYEPDKPLARLLKKKRKPTRRVREGDVEGRPRAPRPENPDKYISAQFVEDSSDDEDDVLAAEYRRRMEQLRDLEYEDSEETAAEIREIQTRLEGQEPAAVGRSEDAPHDDSASEDEEEAESSSSSSDESEVVEAEQHTKAIQQRNQLKAKKTLSEASEDDRSDAENIAPKSMAGSKLGLLLDEQDAEIASIIKRRKVLVESDEE